MVERETAEWRLLGNARAGVGEGPVYAPDDGALFWIGIFEPTLNRTDTQSGETRKWRLPTTGGSYALLDDASGAVVACADGIHHLDFSSGRTRLLCGAPYNQEDFRFNDGLCDPHGRFWVGTIRLPGSLVANGSGHFYRYDGTTLAAQIGGVTIANGIAFSPAGTTMYLADRVNARLLAYDYNTSTGTASDERVFVALPEGLIADGAAVDARGGYWIAMFKSGEVRRYLADGTLDRIVETPVSQPTMCAFGGGNLETMFLTTAYLFLEPEQAAREPHAGAVFAADVGERGLPEPRFDRSRLPLPTNHDEGTGSR
ncbi:MAG: SMP-30/Gluconolaconase/LRE domain protein [Modestobacter sp.]|nr:SMP-30/Gluconolaconase/LRE domain protein [Modestobacter sp.]